MKKYISTWEVKFFNPENEYLNVEENTVCGIFDREQEAYNKIYDMACAPLFYGCKKYLKKITNGLKIDYPGYMKAKFIVFESNIN